MRQPFVLERLSQPEIEPVTLAEMKRHLRCYADVLTEDADITGLIVSAREWVEEYTGRALVDQKWRLSLRGSPLVGGPPLVPFGLIDGELLLRRSPILALTAFKTVDAAGVETDVPVEGYQLREADSKWPRVTGLGGVWPSGGLRIEFRAGYANRAGSPKDGAEVVPTRFRQAMKLWAEANYDRDPVMMPLLLKVAAEIIQPENTNLQIA